MQSRVIDQKIIGTKKETSKIYLCTWFHCANHGVSMVYADDETQAKEMQWYGSNDEITWLIVEVQPDNLPVVFMGESMKGDL